MPLRLHLNRHLSTHVPDVKFLNDFKFEKINSLIKNKPPKRINIDDDHKKLFYQFLQSTNVIIYSKRNKQKKPPNNEDELKGIGVFEEDNDTKSLLKRNGTNSAHELYQSDAISASSQLCDGDYIPPNTKWLCDKITRILSEVSIDNRIIILQRALSAWHYTNGVEWYKLITHVLRLSLGTEYTLSSKQLVKVYASLSKWRFKDISEFYTRLDLSVLSQSEWNLYDSSQLLWSLAHLKLFNVSFEYLNNKIITLFNESNITINNVNNSTIHRIVSSNLMRISHLGSVHPINNVIVDFFKTNLDIVKCFDTKTLVVISSLFPYTHCDDRMLSFVLDRLLQSLYQYTPTQAIQLLYAFTIINDKLPSGCKDLLTRILYNFKEFICNSDTVLLPTSTCKLMHTLRICLNNYDAKFLNKCLADLNANLHLIEPFSLLGNLQCLIHCSIELTQKHGHRNQDSSKTNIENTLDNLLLFDTDGNLMKKKLNGTNIPMDHLKLWHYGVLTRLTGYDYNIYNHLYDFMTNCHDNPNLKNFALFLLNIANNPRILDVSLLNLILLTACKLWNYSDVKSNYWQIIHYHLMVFDVDNVFEREVGYKSRAYSVDTLPDLKGDKSIHMRYNSSIKLLQLFIKRDEDGFLEHVGRLEYLTNEELIIIKLFILNSYVNGGIASKLLDKCTSFDIKAALVDRFHEPWSMGKVVKADSEQINPTTAKLVKQLSSRTVPIPMELMYTRLYFLQDYPQFMFDLLPSLYVGEMTSTAIVDVNLFQLAEWLGEAKKSTMLTDYLKLNNVVLDTTLEGKLVEVHSTCGDLSDRITDIRKNCYVGPYLASFALCTDVNKIYIFVSPVKSSFSLYDKIRRAVLNNCKIIELHHRRC